MKARRPIYIIALALAVFLIYNWVPEKQESASLNISKEKILKDFENLKDKNIPMAVLGGTFYTTRAYFPLDFSGEAGNVFYVSMEDGHIAVTQKYMLKYEKSSASSYVYDFIQRWEDYRPPQGRFETYSFNGSQWTKEETGAPPEAVIK